MSHINKLLFLLGMSIVGGCSGQLVEFPDTDGGGADGTSASDGKMIGAGSDLRTFADLKNTPDQLLFSDLKPGTPDLFTTLDLTSPVGLPDLTLPVSLPDLTLPVTLPDLTLPVTLPDLTFPVLVPDLSLVADLSTPAVDSSLPSPDLIVVVASTDMASPKDMAMDMSIDMSGSADLTELNDLSNAQVCGAVLFDGLHAVVTAPTQTYLNPTGALTVEAWVYAQAFGPNEQVVVSHWGDDAVGTASWALLLDSTGHPELVISKTGSDKTLFATATTPVNLNQWTHVAGVFDPGFQVILAFTDGDNEGMTAATGVLAPFPIMSTELSIGRYSFATPIERPFTGYIDSPRVSSVARYTQPFTPKAHYLTDSATIALYRFDETMGQTAADVSSNANVATLEQNAVFANPPICRPGLPSLDGGVLSDLGANPSGPVPPPLNGAAIFGALAGATVTNIGFSVITGSVGVGPGSAITGFPPGIITGVELVGGAAQTAEGDVGTAYDYVAALPCGTAETGVNLGGQTLAPGVYCMTSNGELNGTLFLDGGGDPNATFYFQIADALLTSVDSRVVLIGGAQSCNVFWQVGTSATISKNVAMVGNILALASVTFDSLASLDGRALARSGDVTLIDNAINIPACTGGILTNPDLGMSDAAPMDGAAKDAAAMDASPSDLGMPDAAVTDMGTSDLSHPG